MKQFLKYTFATIFGLFVFSFIVLFLGLILLVGLIAADSSKTVEVKENSVLVVKLDGKIVEHATSSSLGDILGYDATSQQGLDDIIGAIDQAAETDEIKGIYIECGMPQTDYATLQEIRNAIVRFKEKAGNKEHPYNGKFVAAYANTYTQGAYYVASAADHVWMNPQGMLDLHGIAAQPMYLKDFMEKFGVKVKVVKVGTYKSATEIFTEEKMSDANREQVTRYLTSIWNTMLNDISKSRKISVESLNSYADGYTALKDTKVLLQQKLIDSTLYADDVKGQIKLELALRDGKTAIKEALKDDKAINQISCSELNSKAKEKATESDKIAVYYCEGSIVQTEEASALSGSTDIVSKKVIGDLEKIAKDDDIKAVVIRINSGGGDAFASEKIWNSVVKLRKKKPVVVSMGGAAASGAYYLSAGASWIVAQPTTLTGSIGIFGTFPDISELTTKKLGIKYDVVKTNKLSDFSMLQASRPFNAEEEAMLQQYINRGYELFCNRVATGRKLPVSKVKEIAEGRVWIGTDALQHKLIDQLGGMREAIGKAASLAKVSKYKTIAFPEEKGLIEQLTEMAENKHNNYLDEQLKATLGTYYEPFMIMRGIEKQSPIQARSEVIPFIN